LNDATNVFKQEEITFNRNKTICDFLVFSFLFSHQSEIFIARPDSINPLLNFTQDGGKSVQLHTTVGFFQRENPTEHNSHWIRHWIRPGLIVDIVMKNYCVSVSYQTLAIQSFAIHYINSVVTVHINYSKEEHTSEPILKDKAYISGFWMYISLVTYNLSSANLMLVSSVSPYKKINIFLVL
jgi:cyclopropane fatty-acyl-phospholipid synthase-like methyltransferase